MFKVVRNCVVMYIVNSNAIDFNKLSICAIVPIVPIISAQNQ